MLEEIRIQGLGVIEESLLELGPGFTVVTGETGAGKTMVVTALGLLMGGRADPGAVRTGSSRAVVEGVVDVTVTTRAAQVVQEAGGEVEDGRLLLGRQVSAGGRSRAFAGGAGVPATVLGQVAECLVAVHGQSDQHRLLKAEAQRDALDRFAGPEAVRLRQTFGEAYRALRTTEAELAEVTASVQERNREADLLRFGLEEIERVSPQPGEDLQLAAEESRLGFADSLRVAAEQARDALSSEDGDPDALAAVGTARRLLEGVRDHDPEAASLADRLAEVSYLLSDLAADVASYSTGLEADPVRLASVSERRASLTALTRKYGDTVDDVLAWSQRSSERLLDLEDTDGQIDQLTARCVQLRADLARLGADLSAVRAEAAERLGRIVTAELTALAMPHAELTIGVAQVPDGSGLAVPTGDGTTRTVRMSASGLDDVELRLAANVGSGPRPLSKGASGGELSRVMLALEVALAGTDPVPTFVFDEVDAGVGGKAAVEVGRRLAMLARNAQVIVVTHLPQVAAFADQHVVVAKSAQGSVTRSGLTTLDDAGRVRELSRMLAGLEGSGTAQAHAQELLDLARTET